MIAQRAATVVRADAPAALRRRLAAAAAHGLSERGRPAGEDGEEWLTS
jgi:hypothetical protein